MGRRLVAQVSDRETLTRFVRAALSHRVEHVTLLRAPVEGGAHTLEIRLDGGAPLSLTAEPMGAADARGFPLLLSPLDPSQVSDLHVLAGLEDLPPSSPGDARRTDPDPDGYDPEVAFISAAPVAPPLDLSLGISIDVQEPVDSLDEERSLSGSVVFDLDVLARERRVASSFPEAEDSFPLTMGDGESPFTVRRNFREIAPGFQVDGKYEILELIGSGSVGAVYRAVHTDLARVVAIKVLHPYYRDEEHFANAFRTEARAASVLAHPSNTTVHDFGTTPDGYVYLVMEHIDGRTLQAILDEERTLDVRRALEIMLQVTSALADAHDHGIIHRDVKPENIMLVPGRDDEGNAIEAVKVCDFGIAAIDTTPPDEWGYTAGTPAYMAPEQTRGAFDARTDIYACAAVLYEMLTGQPPLLGQTPSQTLRKVTSEDPKPPSAMGIVLPPGLEATTMRALAKEPTSRHASIRDLRSDLKRILMSLP